MSYTLGQAAKATGKSKPTVLQAIRNGRLSATRDDKNQWQIDPAELDRVYPLNVKTERDETPNNTCALQATIEHLRELLGEIKGERDDLRRRLDTEAEERRKAQTQLTALLTDQRPKPEPEAQPEQQPQQAANQNPRRSLWATLKKWV